MNTIALGMPRLSRVKVLVGALLATLAIAGTVQADSASAMPAQCQAYVDAGHYWERRGVQSLADMFYDKFWPCIEAHQGDEEWTT